MKVFFSICLSAALFFCAFAAPKNDAADDAPYFFEKDKATLLQKIKTAEGPIVRGDYVVFTAKSDARWAAVAFESEDYKDIHSFEKIILRNEKGEEESSFLFYIYEIPQKTSEIKYRMIIDGLWTTDPLNKNTVYDLQHGILLSSVAVERKETIKTEQLADGRVRFVYRGKSKDRVSLAGSFNNWDPFMYYLEAVAPGFQQITIPVAKGRQFYCFFVGAKREPDQTNPDRDYLDDGKFISIIDVK